jgi:hypothetical protein
MKSEPNKKQNKRAEPQEVVVKKTVMYNPDLEHGGAG